MDGHLRKAGAVTSAIELRNETAGEGGRDKNEPAVTAGTDSGRRKRAGALIGVSVIKDMLNDRGGIGATACISAVENCDAKAESGCLGS